MELPDWWTPVRRTEIEVVGPNQREPALLNIRFELGPVPRDYEQWVRYFLDPQLDHWGPFNRPGNESSSSLGLGFVGSVEDERLKEYVETIDRCAEDANRKFEREDVPRLVETDERRTEDTAAAEERLERARRQLEDL